MRLPVMRGSRTIWLWASVLCGAACGGAESGNPLNEPGGSGGASLGGAAAMTQAGASGAGAPSAGSVSGAGVPSVGGMSPAGSSGAAGASGSAGSAGNAAGNENGGGNTNTGGVGGSGGSPSSCDVLPKLPAVQGWAAVSGLDVATTTGGGALPPQLVKTLDELKQAVKGTDPAVIQIQGVLEAGAVAVGSNKTLIGSCGAELHGHLGISHASNVIVANLKIVGYGVGDCSKDPDFDAEVGCSSGADAVSITGASHHVWFDHCDISDGTDGNLDINAGSDFVTISWTKFHYTPRTDDVGDDSTGKNGHRFSNLIGSSDTVAGDVGHLNVTFHHNWWAENVVERMPRTRRGKIHVVNNLFTSTGNHYCTNAGHEAHLLVENNIYEGVATPLKPDDDGDMLARGNVFTDTSGTKTADGTGFTPQYAYDVNATGGLEDVVRSGAGPH